MSARDPLSLDEAAQALQFVDAADRDVWLKLGRALKAEFGDVALDVWRDWTEATGTENKRKEVKSQWASFRNSRTTIGTLIHLCMQAGWSRQPSTLSEDEKRQRREEREQRRREAEARAEQEAQADAAWCRKLSGVCHEALKHFKRFGNSPYLAKKQVAPFGVLFPQEPMILICDRDADRAELLVGYEQCKTFWQLPEDDRPRFRSLKKGTFVIPMVDGRGAIWNFQIVYASGKKLFLPGIKTGLFHLIGEVPEEGEFDLMLVEGYATGASLHMATQWPVVVAWDSGNLVHVAEVIRAKWGERIRTLALMGDNDAHLEQRGEKNAGVEAAHRAAKLWGGVAVFPDFGLLEGVAA